MPDFIKINKWPADHARDAYESGYYIEALQTLHGWIEVKLRELLQLQRINAENESQKSEWSKAWNMTNELSLNQIAKALFIIGELPEETLSKTISFNRVRNNMIHKLFNDPHESEYLGIPREEYDRAFKDGISLSYTIENMSAEKIA